MTNPSDSSAASTTTSTGLSANVAGALSYLLGFITGIVFLVLEKQNKFVRFHAAQSIAVSVALVVLSIALSILSGVLAFIPILGWIVALLLSVVLGFGSFILWLVLMFKAFGGHEWEVPFAGQWARRIAGQ
jgi:uncharacterized membrane protein